MVIVVEVNKEGLTGRSKDQKVSEVEIVKGKDQGTDVGKD